MEFSKEIMDVAFERIKESYCKVLTVNFSTDTFKAGIIANDEWNAFAKDVSSNTEYWDKFANSDFLHNDDKDEFIRFYYSMQEGTLVYRRLINGEFRWVYLQMIKSVNYSEDNKEFIVYVKDIDKTYSKAYESVISKVGVTDSQTGLLNRFAYQRDIAKADGKLMGMIFCDINGLKYTNDHFGHEAGDKLILGFAGMLKDDFKKLKCYHISGDEFVVMDFNADMSNFPKLARDFEREVNAMEIPIASVGFAISYNMEILREDAETDMYKEKELFYLKYPAYKR